MLLQPAQRWLGALDHCCTAHGRQLVQRRTRLLLTPNPGPRTPYAWPLTLIPMRTRLLLRPARARLNRRGSLGLPPWNKCQFYARSIVVLHSKRWYAYSQVRQLRNGRFLHQTVPAISPPGHVSPRCELQMRTRARGEVLQQ